MPVSKWLPVQLSCHLCQRQPDDKPGWVSDHDWAICPKCISQGKAIVADCGRQDWGLGGPIGAYWDQQRHCQYCGRDYVFSAKEQQFWYEEQRFITQSAPIACVACRKELRSRVRANDELTALGRVTKGSSWKSLEQRAELAYRAGSGRRALEYLRRAKNACSEAELKERLIQRIAEWEVSPPPVLKRKFRRVSRWVDQIERQYGFVDPPWLSWEERQKGLAQPALPPDQTHPVARFDGSRLESLDGGGPDTWYWKDSDGTLRPWSGKSGAKVTIDPDTGVMLWLPGSGASGRTGFFARNGMVYGRKGPFPWLVADREAGQQSS